MLGVTHYGTPFSIVDKQVVAVIIPHAIVEGAAGVIRTDCEVYPPNGLHSDLVNKWIVREYTTEIVKGKVIHLMNQNAENFFHGAGELMIKYVCWLLVCRWLFHGRSYEYFIS